MQLVLYELVLCVACVRRPWRWNFPVILLSSGTPFFFFCIKNSLNVKSLSIANKNQAQIATIAETFCLCIDYHVFAQLDLYYI